MMIDDGDNSPLKLVDFGLSKLLGPNETSNEPFGTLVILISFNIPSLMWHQKFSSRNPMGRMLICGVWVS